MNSELQNSYVQCGNQPLLARDSPKSHSALGRHPGDPLPSMLLTWPVEMTRALSRLILVVIVDLVIPEESL